MILNETFQKVRAKLGRVDAAEAVALTAARARDEAQAELDAAERALAAETAEGRAAAEREAELAELHRLESLCTVADLAAANTDDIKAIVVLEAKIRALVERVQERGRKQAGAAFAAEMYAGRFDDAYQMMGIARPVRTPI